MLVLTRKKGESIMIGDSIELVVIGVEGDLVKLGIRAPKSVEVYRKELYDSIQSSNKEATERTVLAQDLSAFFRKEK
ncbi:carbon storage regulator CsrA [Paenibacillus hemerocallicola]|jgi:carbon storage regulator|uniref:Translational regulator CsrA n=1 Tax=Paenibacillus hemerocallicola TaxID=1172614 RepID=A0A5C4T6S4_9BACL|nr:carbon storage regulator CsrA [Paenibacillus hemerocallicola]TNJ64758.1 carbon storage regulator CsrA [Paenibacillus hemerocallicola]